MKIYKYPFEIADKVTIIAPPICMFVHWGRDPQGKLCVWAQVDPEGINYAEQDPSNSVRGHSFYIRGTGQETPAGRAWVHTFVDDAFVWHVFI